MTEDLLSELDAQTAKALRAIDLAATIATYLQKQATDLPSYGAQAAARALAVRQAIIGAGVPLPDLRALGDGSRAELAAGNPNELRIQEIAEMGGVDRATVKRWLRKVGGTIGAKYAEARRQGLPPVFTREEAREILRGNVEWG